MSNSIVSLVMRWRPGGGGGGEKLETNNTKLWKIMDRLSNLVRLPDYNNIRLLPVAVHAKSSIHLTSSSQEGNKMLS